MNKSGDSFIRQKRSELGNLGRKLIVSPGRGLAVAETRRAVRKARPLTACGHGVAI